MAARAQIAPALAASSDGALLSAWTLTDADETGAPARGTWGK
jgi:hypothetical protein